MTEAASLRTVFVNHRDVQIEYIFKKYPSMMLNEKLMLTISMAEGPQCQCDLIMAPVQKQKEYDSGGTS